MGLRVLDVGPGWSKATASYREDLVQPAGIMHGGDISSQIDTGIAHALMMTDRLTELHREGGALVSVDLRVKFIRPVAQGTIFCDAKIVRLGRQIVHAEAIVTGEDGKEVARGDAIYMAVPQSQIERQIDRR
jgi:acyl-CoA thioesterase